jgi:hypothetical protein
MNQQEICVWITVRLNDLKRDNKIHAHHRLANNIRIEELERILHDLKEDLIIPASFEPICNQIQFTDIQEKETLE